jgi:transcriptional regulator with XRE-family HTH domain
MMQIHERIKAERLKQKLSEEEVAGRLDIPRSTYQYWETKTPHVDKIKAVAKALGHEENFFFVTPDEYFLKEAEPVDENIVTSKTNDEKEHGTQVSGLVLSGGRVLVEAKDLTASYERILEEKEARRIEAKERAERAEKENDRLLTIIENNLTALLTNSGVALDRLSLVETIIRSDDTVIMNNQDLQNGKKVGTSAKEAGSRQLAADKRRKGKGNQAGVHKTNK